MQRRKFSREFELEAVRLVKDRSVAVAQASYLAEVLTRIVNGHPNSQIDDLLPWAYIRAPEFRAVA
jgi:hypothetical protein